MKVILNSDVEKLGKIGDVVEVKSGFARNFLFPRDFAIKLNQHNLGLIKIRKEKWKKKMEVEKLSAIEQRQRLEEITLKFFRKAGDSEVLFGSVSVVDIAQELEKQGFKIEKRKFHLNEPIKRLGNYSCKIKLFEEVDVDLKIEVAKEGEETKPE